MNGSQACKIGDDNEMVWIKTEYKGRSLLSYIFYCKIDYNAN